MSADRQSTIQMNNDLLNFEKSSVYMISVKGETLKQLEKKRFLSPSTEILNSEDGDKTNALPNTGSSLKRIILIYL